MQRDAEVFPSNWMENVNYFYINVFNILIPFSPLNGHVTCLPHNQHAAKMASFLPALQRLCRRDHRLPKGETAVICRHSGVA